jgi:hypothetical protein
MEYISCAETAKHLRAALAKEFPGIKFSVRSKTYSGGASITVCWTDGPLSPKVKEVCCRFEGADFDGMQDLKSYVTQTFEGRPVHFGADFIFTNRRISNEEAQVAEAAAWLREHYRPSPNDWEFPDQRARRMAFSREPGQNWNVVADATGYGSHFLTA